MRIPDCEPTMPLVDISQLNDGGPVPKGEYHLKVIKAVYVSAPKGNNANPYIEATHESTAAPEGLSRCIGRHVFMNYPIQGKRDYYLRQLLDATGYSDEYDQLHNPSMLVNREFGAIVDIKSGNGKWRDRNTIITHSGSSNDAHMVPCGRQPARP